MGCVSRWTSGPALLELAGVMPPEHMEAESLLPALKGDDWRPREMVFAEHGRDGILEETEFMTMARTDEWKLVYFLDEPFGQLFNLKRRPRRDAQPVGRPELPRGEAGAAGRAAELADAQRLSDAPAV